MSGVIDTNLLLYAANADAPEHGVAARFLLESAASAQAWFLTEGILYEFLRVTTHPKVFPRPLGWKQAVEFLEPLVGSERFQVLVAGPRHFGLLAQVLSELTHPAGNLLFDVRTAVLMREHGVRRIFTTDTDFLQFRDLEVVNPLRED